MNELYQAIKRHYPDKSDAALDRMMGFGHGCIAKIRRGVNPGLNAAKWMAEHHPECRPMAEKLLADWERDHVRDNGRFGRKKPSEPPQMSRMCMAMAGYLP